MSRPLLILIAILVLLVIGLGILGSRSGERPLTRVEAPVLDGATAR